jgi:hypothetical protein
MTVTPVTNEAMTRRKRPSLTAPFRPGSDSEILIVE